MSGPRACSALWRSGSEAASVGQPRAGRKLTSPRQAREREEHGSELCVPRGLLLPLHPENDGYSPPDIPPARAAPAVTLTGVFQVLFSPSAPGPTLPTRLPARPVLCLSGRGRLVFAGGPCAGLVLSRPTCRSPRPRLLRHSRWPPRPKSQDGVYFLLQGVPSPYS